MEGLIPLMFRAYRAKKKRSKYRHLSESPPRSVSGWEWEKGGDPHPDGDYYIRRSASEVHPRAALELEDLHRRSHFHAPPPPGALAPSQSTGHGAAAAIAVNLDSLRRTKSGVAW